MGSERGEASDKLLLKKTVKKKANFLFKKPRLDPVEVYNLVKRFFRLFLEKDCEYTREEMMGELDKFYLEEGKKERLVEIVKSLGRVEFSNPEFSQDELNSMLEDFVALVQALVHEERNKISFWDKIANRFTSKSKSSKKKNKEERKTQLQLFAEEVESGDSVQGEKEVEKMDDEVEEDDNMDWTGEDSTGAYAGGSGEVQGGEQTYQSEENTQSYEESYYDSYEEGQEALDSDNSRFEKVLSEFYDNLDSDLARARVNYGELSELYEGMNDEEKNVYYSQLSRAYEDLNSRI